MKCLPTKLLLIPALPDVNSSVQHLKIAILNTAAFRDVILIMYYLEVVNLKISISQIYKERSKLSDLIPLDSDLLVVCLHIVILLKQILRAQLSLFVASRIYLLKVVI